MAPSTPSSHSLNKIAFKCTISESCCVNLSFSGQVGFQKKILEIFSYINTCKTVSPIMAPPDPPGTMFLQTLFCTIPLGAMI